MADDLKEFCKSQLKRLKHLDGFPREKEAVTDYLTALMVAKSTDRARAVIDEFIQAEPIDRKCPTAAMIRRVAYDKQEKQEVATRECNICDGTGVQTVWKLITYRGKSFVVEKAETLPGVTCQEQANGFMEQMAKSPSNLNQTVLTAAKLCQCRSAGAQATQANAI